MVVYTVGKIDLEKFIGIVDNIRTNEVIITDERIRHIRERRGNEFYEKYSHIFQEILSDPDYIFKDLKENTVLVCKSVIEDEKYINIVLKIAVETDDPIYKNSIITAIGENWKRFSQRLRNNIPLYKKE